jgi:DNA excision repair protein ERCC-4
VPGAVADVHEQLSGVPDRLRGLGLSVAVEALSIGDYVLARRVVVERKSVADLHDSVIEGRFWRQIGMLRRGAARPYLLIEGGNIDRGPLRPSAVRGVCVAVLELGVPIIRSTGAADSAAWLARLASRAEVARPTPDRPVYDQKPSPRPHLVSEAVLAAVPGISVKIARRLLARFGTVAAVVSAGPEEWSSIEGIGRARAARLARAFGLPD